MQHHDADSFGEVAAAAEELCCSSDVGKIVEGDGGSGEVIF